MKYSEFRTWLVRQGAVISPGKGSHQKVTLNGRSSVLPFHGSKEWQGARRTHQKGPWIEGLIMLQYPLSLEEDDNGTLLVGFPDIPEAHSVGDDITDALVNALNAFETVFDLYVEDARPMPAPSVVPGGPTLVVPVQLAERIQRWNAQFRTAT